ncbi:hypothetical protein MNB_SUP05-SYMBIONT-5-74 [hydrothermal vent metagenome]|uniref:Uncharacterized protein n=1 Tax=hydrothermal vent metagenome TaxID=652676 RepID=A0A1W1E4R2_9ZZZZ
MHLPTIRLLQSLNLNKKVFSLFKKLTALLIELTALFKG